MCDELGECVFGGSKEGNDGEGVSSSSLSSSTEPSRGMDHSGVKVHRPEFQQKKAKLLYMQDEVSIYFCFLITVSNFLGYALVFNFMNSCLICRWVLIT